jgi:hypothetical protein
VALEHESETGREEDVAIFATFAFLDEDFTLVKINIADFNVDQFADSHSGQEEELEHDLVLKVTALLEHAKELFQFGLG